MGGAMFDIDALLETIPLEEVDLSIDHDFIVDFLAPYFPHLATTDLRATLSRLIMVERERGLTRG